MKTHYITKDANQSGPYSIEEIMDKIATGEFTEDDLCWAQGMTEWESIRTVLSPVSNIPPPPSPSVEERPSSSAAPSVDATSSHSASSSLPEALKNLAISLLTFIKMLFGRGVSAAKSDKAKRATKLVTEKSSMLRKKATEMASSAANSDVVRSAAEKINKGAADIRNKASSLANPDDLSPVILQPTSPGSSRVTSESPAFNQDVKPTKTNNKNHRKINCISALVFFCIAIAMLAFAELSALDSDEKSVFIFSLLGLPFFLLALFSISKLHYRCWMALPENFRTISPTKAVGFMYIPFYNFYWGFVTWPQLTDGLAKWQQSVGIDTGRAKWLGVTLAIIFVGFSTIGLIPGVGLVTKIAMLAIFIPYYRKTVFGINLMLDQESDSRLNQAVNKWTFKRIAIVSAVALPVYIFFFGIAGDRYDRAQNRNKSTSRSSYSSNSSTAQSSGKYRFNSADQSAMRQFNETYDVTITIGKRNGLNDMEILRAAVKATDWSGASSDLNAAVKDFLSIKSGESAVSRNRKMEKFSQIMDTYSN